MDFAGLAIVYHNIFQEYHAKFISSILDIKSSSLVRACISVGSVFHIVGAKVRKLLYSKVIWLDFGIVDLNIFCRGVVNLPFPYPFNVHEKAQQE